MLYEYNSQSYHDHSNRDLMVNEFFLFSLSLHILFQGRFITHTSHFIQTITMTDLKYQLRVMHVN